LCGYIDELETELRGGRGGRRCPAKGERIERGSERAESRSESNAGCAAEKIPPPHGKVTRPFRIA
jgi:hypothetical protein